MVSMRSAMVRMPLAIAADPSAARDAAAAALDDIVGIGEFVGDDQGREKDKPRLADLAVHLDELADLAVDIGARGGGCAAPRRRRRSAGRRGR